MQWADSIFLTWWEYRPYIYIPHLFSFLLIDNAKRGRQSLSLFTSLPEDLRRSIRSKSGDATQLTVQHPVNTPTLPVDSLFSTQTLLRTQPYSDNGGEEEQGEKRVDLLGIKSILVNDSGTIDESGEKDTTLMEVSQAQIPVERQSPPNQNESHRMETSASLSPTGRRKSESYDVNWLGSTNKIVKLSTAKARKQAKKDNVMLARLRTRILTIHGTVPG